MSVYFFAIYGSCIAITARRSDVGHAAFAWERYIPFVPAMIVPYMSIDLFFFAAPFLCTRRRELRQHARRIILAITIAGACFLLFPLRMAFSPTAGQGVFAPIFKLLHAFDQPYNLAPSLHIALWSLLWVIYMRHTRGAMRLAVQSWFILIGVSTLLTYQHQVLDVLAGQFLGLFCLHVFPDSEPAARDYSHLPGAQNRTIAARYSFSALVILATAYLMRPWGLLLLWPGCSLAIMALAYLGIGPAVFRKRGGRLPLSTYIVLGPYLLGAYVSFLFYKSRDVASHQVTPQFFIGRRLGHAEARALIQSGVHAVLDLTAECAETRPLRHLTYKNIPILDLIPPSLAQLDEAVSFIRQHIVTGGVYVHCALGYSRSACVAAAYLISTGQAATAGEAIAMTLTARPKAVLGDGLHRLLQNFSIGWCTPPARLVYSRPLMERTRS